MLFILQGCLNYTQITTLKTDGSGEMFIHYWMNYSSQEAAEFIEMIGLFNSDSIKKEFTSKYIDIEYIETYRDQADSTIHGKIKFNFTGIDSLNYTEVFSGCNFVFTDGEDDTKMFSQEVQPMATGVGFDHRNFVAEYVYYIPGDVIEHNGDDLSNHKLTWRFSVDEIGSGKTLKAIFIPYKLKETPLWIYYSAIGVFLIVLFYLFKKRRS